MNKAPPRHTKGFRTAERRAPLAPDRRVVVSILIKAFKAATVCVVRGRKVYTEG